MRSLTFTGTQIGMTERQKIAVQNLLREIRPTIIHHGACVGADQEFDQIARALNFPIYTHPSNVTQALWATRVGEGLNQYPIMNPLKRNREMVDLAQIVIACPATETEVLRSGTWSTVRYTRKHPEKTLYIINPDGRIK